MITHFDESTRPQPCNAIPPQSNGQCIIPFASAGYHSGDAMHIVATARGLSSTGVALVAVGEYVYQGQDGAPPILTYGSHQIRSGLGLGYLANLVDSAGDIVIQWRNAELANPQDVVITVALTYFSTN
jgi:hypothetical protein